MTDDCLRALAEMVGLPLAADHLPGVAANLQHLLDQARAMPVDLPVEMEPAPIFRP